MFSFHKVYQLDGTTLGKDWVMKTYHDIFVKFVDEHRHEFSGGKVIYSGLRSVKLRRRYLYWYMITPKRKIILLTLNGLYFSIQSRTVKG